jgi:hypothetical protein
MDEDFNIPTTISVQFSQCDEDRIFQFGSTSLVLPAQCIYMYALSELSGQELLSELCGDSDMNVL